MLLGSIMSAPPRKRTKVVVEQQLNDLRTLLEHLPSDLPEPTFSQYNFGPITTDELEDYGDDVSSVVHRLEQELGHLNPDSPYHIQIKERGRGPLAVVDFLEKYYNKNRDAILLQEWIAGLLTHVKEISDAELDDSMDTGIKVWAY
jgi:hypothetical protein